MNFNKRSNFGFTLIELLVVIAIIAILAAVALIFLGPARKKGQDASIQSQMKSLQNQIELTFVGVSYAPAFSIGSGDYWASSDAKIQTLLTEINKQTTVHRAGSDASGWAAQARLVNDTTKYFCVDTSSKGSISTTQMAAGATVCP